MRLCGRRMSERGATGKQRHRQQTLIKADKGTWQGSPRPSKGPRALPRALAQYCAFRIPAVVGRLIPLNQPPFVLDQEEAEGLRTWCCARRVWRFLVIRSVFDAGAAERAGMSSREAALYPMLIASDVRLAGDDAQTRMVRFQPVTRHPRLYARGPLSGRH